MFPGSGWRRSVSELEKTGWGVVTMRQCNELQWGIPCLDEFTMAAIYASRVVCISAGGMRTDTRLIRAHSKLNRMAEGGWLEQLRGMNGPV